MYKFVENGDACLKSGACRPTDGSVDTQYKLDEFYSAMAKEEGCVTFKPKTKMIHLLDFVVAGTTFCKEFDKKNKDFVKNGMSLVVRRENNKHDANAIALYVNEIKVGYVPKAQNAILAKLLDAGKFLVARVTNAHYKEGWEKIDASIWMVEL